MKIALAQFNPIVGDIAGNSVKIARNIDRAAEAGADLVVFAELSVVGYPPRDLLRKERFVTDNVRAVEMLARRCTKIAALVGFVRPTPQKHGRPLQNCAALLAGGEIRHVHAKSLLPTYDVFDETRYFEPGGPGKAIPSADYTDRADKNKKTEKRTSVSESVKSAKSVDGFTDTLGISICEDLWDEQALGHPLYRDDPIAELMNVGANVIVNMAASPYQMGKADLKERLFARQAKRAKATIVYVNQIGGNDELIFDGGSCVISPEGKVIGRAKSFDEDLLVVDLAATCGENRCEPMAAGMARLSEALKLGLRDYIAKCGFRSAVLGLSGGIDSAVVAALAADAIGPGNVYALAMPSRYSSDHSLTDAEAIAHNLGIHYEVIPIEPVHAAYESSLKASLAGGDAEIAGENVQARIRGNIVMAVSNAFGHLALATGNKSELSTGYCTLYGDMAGGLAVIGDVLKTDIFRLAHQLNKDRPEQGGGERIPIRVIDKPPSAELKPNQFDQDKLPPYELLDAILKRYVEQDRTAQEIIDEGYDAKTVLYVVRLVDSSEYKRKQAAPVLKATPRAFGSGRRMPIAQRYVPKETTL